MDHARPLRVTTRNARFQEWQALLRNRAKRQRRGECLVQGVRPITMAVRSGWPVRELLYDADARLSAWARSVLDEIVGRGDAAVVAVSRELMAELGGRPGGGPERPPDRVEPAPELLAVVALPADDLARVPAGPAMLAVAFDRPTSPGNIGTLIRSADAFGASGVIVTGHAADPYDPQSVRASTGSLFAVPVVRVGSHRPVIDWVDALRASGTAVRVVGTDEGGNRDVGAYDLTGPTVVVVGNETYGLSVAWRDACQHLLRIPMVGTASSLNAATAASIVLYEAARQRAAGGGPPPSS